MLSSSLDISLTNIKSCDFGICYKSESKKVKLFGNLKMFLSNISKFIPCLCSNFMWEG